MDISPKEQEEFEFRARLEQEQSAQSSQVATVQDKKSLLPDISFFKQSDPNLYALAKTGQDVATIPAHFFNQRGFNAPRAITEKLGYQYPSQTDNPVARIAAPIAGVAGMVTSPIAKGIEAFAPGRGLVPGVTRGAMYGAAYSPEDVTDLKSRAVQSGVGAVAGGVLSPLGKLFQRKQIAQQTLKESGKYIGETKDALVALAQKEPTKFTVNTNYILKDLQDAFSKINDKSGSAGNAIKKWIRILNTKGNRLFPDTLIEMESQLGNSVKFSEIKGGAFTRTEPKNNLTERLLKDTRNKVSNEVNRMAKAAGFDKFSEHNKTYSKILQKWSDLDPTKGRGDIFARGFMAGGIGAIAQSAPLAAVAYEAMKYGASPEARNAFYKFLESNAGKNVSRGIRGVGTSLTSNVLSGSQ